MAKLISSKSDYRKRLTPTQKRKYDKLKEKKEGKRPSFFKRTLSLLTTGETAGGVYAALEGKNPITQYGSDIFNSVRGYGYNNKTYKDVLLKLGMDKTYLSEKMPWVFSKTGKGIKFKEKGLFDFTDVGSLGLAGDIVLDPKTYMGGLGLFKRFTDTVKGTKGLTKAGISKFDDVMKPFLKEADTIGDVVKAGMKRNEGYEAASIALKANADKYFTGITFAGKEVVPRKVALILPRGADWTMSHVPLLNRAYTGTKYALQDIFQVGASALRAGKNVAGARGEETVRKFLRMTDDTHKAIKYADRELSDKLIGDRKVIQKMIGEKKMDDLSRYLTDTIETKFSHLDIDKIDKATADSLADKFIKLGDDFYTAEKGVNEKIGKEMYDAISGYMPHVTSKYGKKALAHKNVANLKLSGWRNWSTKSEKGRSLFQLTDEGGKKLSGSPFAMSYKRLDKDKYIKLIEDRGQKEIKQIQKVLDRLTKKDVDVKLKDLQDLLKTIRKHTSKEDKIWTSSEILDPTKAEWDNIVNYVLKPKKSALELKTLEKELEMALSQGKEFLKPTLGAKISSKAKAKQLYNKIFKVQQEIQENIAKAQKFDFIDKSGKMLKIDRAMSITEINKMMQPFMDASSVSKGKKFLETDPFAVMLSRGMESNKRVQRKLLMHDIGKEFGVKNLDEVPEGMEAVRYIDPKIEEMGDVLIPDFLVKELKQTRKLLSDDDTINNIIKGYDKVLQEWKGLIYGWIPQSHGRNFLGGSFNNTVANPKWIKFSGKHVKKILDGSDETIKLAGEIYTYKQLQQYIRKSGILGQTGYLDVNNLIREFNPTMAKKAKRLPIKAMEVVEDNLRIPLFLAEMDKGKTLAQARNQVFKYHFDYAPEALTAIERDVLKRFIPFYKWNRENIPLMIEELISHPGKMTGFYKMMRDATDEDGRTMVELMPSYMESEMPIVKGGQTVQFGGLPPIEMMKYLSDPLKSFTSSLSPFMKVPVELATNYNSFKDRQISEDRNGEFARNYPQAVKDFFEWEDSSFEKDGKQVSYSKVNPLRKYLAYAIPTSRLMSIYTDIAGEKEKNKLLKLLTGIRTWQSDMETLKSISDSQYKKQLEELLLEAGLFYNIKVPSKR